MVAETVPSAFLLSSVERCEGRTILLAPCEDYDAYRALPSVLKYEGAIYSLTGWNSDKGYACWQVTHRVAWKP